PERRGGTMLSAFLRWWVGELAGLIPARWRGPETGSAAIVVSLASLEAAAPEAVIAVQSRRGEEVLCRTLLDEAGAIAVRAILSRRRRPSRSILRLPGTALLEREVTLPLAAEWDPVAVIGNDLDRLTPFGREELVWTAETMGRDRARGRLFVRLSFVPRAVLAGSLPLLARLGLQPEAIEVALPDRPGAGGKADGGKADGGAFRRLPLDGRDHHDRQERRRLRLAGACVAVLAVAACVQPFVRQSLAERATAARIAALGPEVSEALALRGRIGNAADGADAIKALRTASGDPVRILAALTRILPDDTWLESLTLSHRQLAITGRSARAAHLIGLIAAAPLFRNPAFTAPVIRAPEGGDEFSIRAELAP
ncbi:MAG: PilN domain-containing protein, partial [Acetobacteraceae bacterium]